MGGRGVRVLAVAAAVALCLPVGAAGGPALSPATAPGDTAGGGGPPLALDGYWTPTSEPSPDDGTSDGSHSGDGAVHGDVATDLAGNGIPSVAMRAYRQAAASLARTDPSCGLDWALLAAIGRVESNHGRYGGSGLTADGTATIAIYGPTLTGIADSDDGRLDGDPSHERAVGPMQFLPGTWALFGADGNGDGVADPQNIDDAALAAGRYLCAGDSDLTADPGAAVFRYNHSSDYVALVLALAEAYRSGGPVDVVDTRTHAPGGGDVRAGGPRPRPGGDEVRDGPSGPRHGGHDKPPPDQTRSPNPGQSGTGNQSPSPTPTASATFSTSPTASPSTTSPSPSPSSTSGSPTSTPSESSSTPTSSPSQPPCTSASPTPSGTATPTPTPSATPTGTPTPTPTRGTPIPTPTRCR